MSVLLTGVQLTKRGFILAMIPYFSLLTWYYVFSYDILRLLVEESSNAFLVLGSLFNFLISFASVLSSFFSDRLGKTTPIYAWSIISSMGTIFIMLAPTDIIKSAIYLLLGVVFGIGISSYFAYFWDLTVLEERGRVVGMIGFIFLPIFSVVTILVRNCDLFRTAGLCVILNLVALSIKPLGSHRMTMFTKKKDSEDHNPEKKTILLYSIPWVIFSLVNATLARTVSFHVSQYFSLSSQMLLYALQIIGVSSGAIMGGVISDFLGRKKSLALGLTLYGICSAAWGLAENGERFFATFIGTGLTWGILFTLYSFVIWGDLATEETCGKRYSIGLATFYSATGLGVLVAPHLFQISLVVASITSSLLIFLSNIPLILAPELLPPDFIEQIRLKLYINLVRRKKLPQ